MWSGFCKASGNAGITASKGHKKRGARNRVKTSACLAAPVAPATTLGRVLKYAQKVYGLCMQLRGVGDGRVKPRIPAGRVALSYVLLLLARLGSLNALEQRKPPPVWAKWLGGKMPSADVMGDVASSLRLDQLRGILGAQHAKAKRNKGFRPDSGGLRFLVLDGHEGVASYRRSWKDCLERVVHCAKADRTQHYFRYVAAYLTNGKQRLMLDAESQLPGEGEIACATRLVTRLLERYPRAFDVVCGDNLYMDPGLWKLIRAHRKHVIAVLKNENRDLLQDARSLLANAAPIHLDDHKVRRTCWDLQGFATWPQCGEQVRVVRSVEETSVRRQNNREKETLVSEWFWVTSLPMSLANTHTIIRAGHGRWHIENYGFNELSNQWHGDHAYRYTAHALVACTLLLFIAYNLFHAFLERNLKPQARAGRSKKYWADLIAAEFVVVFHRSPKPT